jgi:hypothetical protein
MSIFRKSVKFYLVLQLSFISSCSSIESTLDSTWDSISEAGDYIYDSVNFWEETEPEQSEAIIIEEAVEVPDYAMPDETPQSFPVQPSFSQQPPMQPYYDPIYRSARQYYFVGPNGTPMLAPQPPPVPQYSIDQVSPVLPYSYNNNLNLVPPAVQAPNNSNLNLVPEKQIPRMLTEEEEMELFGIQNNCIQVVKDLVNGGYACDDFD